MRTPYLLPLISAVTQQAGAAEPARATGQFLEKQPHCSEVIQ